MELDYAGAKGLTESGAARVLVHGIAAHAGLAVQEEDVVPLAKYDSRGLSAFYVVFGVTLSSFALAQGLTGAAGRVRLRHRLYAMGGFAIVIGAVAATIAGPVLGALNAPWFALAASLKRPSGVANAKPASDSSRSSSEFSTGVVMSSRFPPWSATQVG
ncbi:hypothetical protein [Leifsonia sp. Leaf336]|uniref:hypothetical protein n=1 Tax=Leifsonia sp. Leaf336 TaxID=1736341 RepID=UPI000A512C6E|nr:hypothetical protein [Leifsonia sp. Leaf336]